MAVSSNGAFLDLVVEHIRSAITESPSSISSRRPDLFGFEEIAAIVKFRENEQAIGHWEDYLDGNVDPLESFIAPFVPEPVKSLDKDASYSGTSAVPPDPTLSTPSRGSFRSTPSSAGYTALTNASERSRLSEVKFQLSSSDHSPPRSPSEEEQLTQAEKAIVLGYHTRAKGKVPDPIVVPTQKAPAPKVTVEHESGESITDSFVEECLEDEVAKTDGRDQVQMQTEEQAGDFRITRRSITRNQANVYSLYSSDGRIDKSIVLNHYDSYDPNFARFFPGQDTTMLDQLGWPRYMGIGLMPNGDLPPRTSRKQQEVMVVHRYYAMQMDKEAEEREMSREEQELFARSTVNRQDLAIVEIEKRFDKMKPISTASDEDSPKRERVSFKGKTASELKAHQNIIVRSFWKAYRDCLTPTQCQFIRQLGKQHDFFCHYNTLIERALIQIHTHRSVMQTYLMEIFVIPVDSDIMAHFKLFELLWSLYNLASGARDSFTEYALIASLNNSLKKDARFKQVTEKIQEKIETEESLGTDYISFRKRCYVRSEHHKEQLRKKNAILGIKQKPMYKEVKTQQDSSRSSRRDRDRKSTNRAASPSRFYPSDRARSPSQSAHYVQQAGEQQQHRRAQESSRPQTSFAPPSGILRHATPESKPARQEQQQKPSDYRQDARAQDRRAQDNKKGVKFQGGSRGRTPSPHRDQTTYDGARRAHQGFKEEIDRRSQGRPQQSASPAQSKPQAQAQSHQAHSRKSHHLTSSHNADSDEDPWSQQNEHRSAAFMMHRTGDDPRCGSSSGSDHASSEGSTPPRKAARHCLASARTSRSSSPPPLPQQVIHSPVQSDVNEVRVARSEQASSPQVNNPPLHGSCAVVIKSQAPSENHPCDDSGIASNLDATVVDRSTVDSSFHVRHHVVLSPKCHVHESRRDSCHEHESRRDSMQVVGSEQVVGGREKVVRTMSPLVKPKPPDPHKRTDKQIPHLRRLDMEEWFGTGTTIAKNAKEQRDVVRGIHQLADELAPASVARPRVDDEFPSAQAESDTALVRLVQMEEDKQLAEVAEVTEAAQAAAGQRRLIQSMSEPAIADPDIQWTPVAESPVMVYDFEADLVSRTDVTASDLAMHIGYDPDYPSADLDPQQVRTVVDDVLAGRYGRPGPGAVAASRFTDSIVEERLGNTDPLALAPIAADEYPDAGRNLGGNPDMFRWSGDPLPERIIYPRPGPNLHPTHLLGHQIKAHKSIYNSLGQPFARGIVDRVRAWGHPWIWFDSQTRMVMLAWRFRGAGRILMPMNEPALATYLLCRLPTRDAEAVLEFIEVIMASSVPSMIKDHLLNHIAPLIRYREGEEAQRMHAMSDDPPTGMLTAMGYQGLSETGNVLDADGDEVPPLEYINDDGIPIILPSGTRRASAGKPAIYYIPYDTNPWRPRIDGDMSCDGYRALIKELDIVSDTILGGSGGPAGSHSFLQGCSGKLIQHMLAQSSHIRNILVWIFSRRHGGIRHTFGTRYAKPDAELNRRITVSDDDPFGSSTGKVRITQR